ncbi:hypothetical protein PENTCL1PPCAC_23247, partial [Pristionchus entomophagus]
LLIEGEKVYVNKGNLAVHSPMFNVMFYGGFAEKNKKEIELKDIDRQWTRQSIFSTSRIDSRFRL